MFCYTYTVQRCQQYCSASLHLIGGSILKYNFVETPRKFIHGLLSQRFRSSSVLIIKLYFNFKNTMQTYKGFNIVDNFMNNV